MGLLELLNPKISKNPVYRGFDSRRNAIGQFGLGMIGGGGLDKMRNAALGGMQGRQADSAYALEQQKQRDAQAQLQQAEQQKNQTMEWMRSYAPQSFAQLQAGLPMAEAFKLAQQEYSQANAPQERRIIEGADGYKYYEGGGQDPTRVIPGIEAPQSSPLVNVNTGDPIDQRPVTGSIAKDFQAIYNPELNTYEASVIPGSPTDIARQNRSISSARSSIAVNRAANSAIALIEKGGSWVAGYGGFLAGLPESDAKAVDQFLTTIRSNVGFDRLAQMRAESPTGGALGQISNLENQLLQATSGSLDQFQDPALLIQNIQEIQRIYAEIDALQAAIASGQSPLDAAAGYKPSDAVTGTTSTGLPWSVQ